MRSEYPSVQRLCSCPYLSGKRFYWIGRERLYSSKHQRTRPRRANYHEIHFIYHEHCCKFSKFSSEIVTWWLFVVYHDLGILRSEFNSSKFRCLRSKYRSDMIHELNLLMSEAFQISEIELQIIPLCKTCCSPKYLHKNERHPNKPISRHATPSSSTLLAWSSSSSNTALHLCTAGCKCFPRSLTCSTHLALQRAAKSAEVVRERQHLPLHLKLFAI